MLLPQIDGQTAGERAKAYFTQVQAESCRRDLRLFVKRAWPYIDPKPYVGGWHIDAICDHLMYVTLGEIRFLMINVPPRSTKSSIVSVAWPAWVWTDHPDIQFLAASYAADLAKIDAQKNRMVIESDWYQERYPVVLLADQNRSDRFANNSGGYRTSISVGSKTTGLGGDIQILDDPHNAQQAESDAIRRNTVVWHDNAWRSRMNDMNKGRKVYVGQRTHDGDVFGHVLAQEGDRWVHLNLPMEYDGSRKCITYANNGSGANKKKKLFEDPRKLPNELLNPKRFNALTAQIEKEGTSTRTWNAQYQQQPEGAGGRILKRAWWREWAYPEWHPDYRKKERELPAFFEVFQSYDTAFEEDEEDDYSVRTTWGLFNHEEVSRNPNTGKVEPGKQQVCAMLLERMKERVGFGDLRDKAIESNKIWEPDLILVEKKASGHSLIQELRKKRLPIKAVLVKGDLIYRTHMSSIVLQKGGIFYLPRPWSMDVIDECAKFPGVDHDDQVASCVIAWQYMRRYRDLQLVDDDTDIDDADELDLFNVKIHRSYYG